MNIKDIFSKQTEFWTEQNIGFFGVVPRDWKFMSTEEVKESLNSDVEAYWKSDDNVCEMARLIFSGHICRNNEDLVKDSIRLEMNPISNCIDIFADFDVRGNLKENLTVASIPSPCPDLTWMINDSKYTPRISAYKDYSMVNSDGKVVKQNGVWHYDIESGEFTVLERKGRNNASAEPATEDPYKSITTRSRLLLEAVLGETLTRDNFEDALKLVPKLDSNSVYTFGFNHLDMFFDLIRSGSRFANPVRNIQLAVNTIFMRQNGGFDEVSDKLVISKSPIFSLENFRTVIYKTKPVNDSGFRPKFTFTDTKGLFDAFKTSTSAGAGRHRMLLDNIEVEDGVLWVVEKSGERYNMFDIMLGKKNNKSHISAISSSLFCNNNDPKRIMMTSKLTAQAVPVVGEEDMFTNRVKARVVFGDFEGWSFADSILISESFAEKLRSNIVLQAEINHKSRIFDFSERVKVGQKVGLDDLRVMFPTRSMPILKNYEDVTLSRVEIITKNRYRVTMKASVPFGLGDKMTNLHGSKGVVGKIIPDDEMPRLKNDIGDFKAGPFEVIISGFSVLRRGSMGQILEAWANASGIEFDTGEDFAKSAVEKYADEMREFSKQSIVEFKGTETIKPCGIIDVIRLYHFASTQVSLSYLKRSHRKMLNLGNMEKLNLVATGKFDTLKELSIRSTIKHHDALWLIYNIMKNRRLPKKLSVSSSFARILKSIGLSMEVEGKELIKSEDTVFHDSILAHKRDLSEVTGKDMIDLDELYGGEHHEEDN